MLAMKNICFYLAVLTTLVSCSRVVAPEPILPIPTKAQVEWQKMEQYAFVHFGINTFNDMEWGYGDSPASTFNPVDLDAESWVKIMKESGLKAVIITAKHHDGFNLWQTKYGDYNLKNSPWRGGKGDVVRDMVDACRKHNMKVGFYLSPWDRNSAVYGTPEYVDYFKNQISELINEYADSIDMFEYWFDGANGGDGYYGGARDKRSIDAKTYYQYDKCVDIIHAKFPDAMIFGGTEPTIRWVGNESGWAGETNWSSFKTPIEETPNNMYGNVDGTVWLPAEVDVSIRPGWFYHAREDHQLHSLAHLVDIYYQSVGRNANLLLNFPIALNGRVHPLDSVRIREWWQTIQTELKTNLLAGTKGSVSNNRGGQFKASAATDGSWDSYWATEDGVAQADITFSFSKPTTLNRLMLQEYIPLGQRVKSFKVDYFSNNKWMPIPTTDSLTTIGYKRIIRFKNIEAEKLRISFLDAKGALCINNIEAFAAPALMVEPVISRDKNGMISILGGDQTSTIYYTTDGSEPTISSKQYTEPFLEQGKIVVKAIAQDPASASRLSPVATKSFDILNSLFKLKDVKEYSAALDGNPQTAITLSRGQKQFTLQLDKPYTITGITYMPDQSRWGGGVITRYKIKAGGKQIAQGEFSNIKANPIEQVVMFDMPIVTEELVVEGQSEAQSNNSGISAISIAELGIITQ